jgi:exodeoxyribonuclease VII large subunit
VIRDILHRIRDRWPCRVLVWPCVVQGDAAAGQVSAAIRGFNALGPGGPVPRPDILIVARGGGSVEDLWAFNDETLARTAAASAIPLISAVGHETDTTLIDFVSDRRAPTPTAAAEMATPVLIELKAAIADYERRLNRCGNAVLEHRRQRLADLARGLPRRDDLLALPTQRFDLAANRLGAGLQRNVAAHGQDLARVASSLKPGLLQRELRLKTDRLAEVWRQGHPCAKRKLDTLSDRLAGLEKLRLSYNPDGPLKRGFARVHHADGHLATSAGALAAGETVRLVFGDGDRSAVIDGASAAAAPKLAAAPKAKAPPPGQGDLF